MHPPRGAGRLPLDRKMFAAQLATSGVGMSFDATVAEHTPPDVPTRTTTVTRPRSVESCNRARS
jgi:hypothetical protein